MMNQEQIKKALTHAVKYANKYGTQILNRRVTIHRSKLKEFFEDIKHID